MIEQANRFANLPAARSLKGPVCVDSHVGCISGCSLAS